MTGFRADVGILRESATSAPTKTSNARPYGGDLMIAATTGIGPVWSAAPTENGDEGGAGARIATACGLAMTGRDEQCPPLRIRAAGVSGPYKEENNMAKIVYQARDMQLTEGGVYTEYLMESTDTTSNLPTDCRYGSLAYDRANNKLYMFDADGSWGEVGA